MRYDAELRTGRNIKQMTWRALQFAQSDPKGPVYLMGAREVMEETLDPARRPASPSRISPPSPPRPCRRRPSTPC